MKSNQWKERRGVVRWLSVSWFYLVPCLLFIAMLHFVSAKVVSTTFSVTATVATYACTVSATTLGFGTYYPSGTTPLQYSNQLQINCNGYLAITVYPDNGLYSSSSTKTTRAMSDGSGHYLSYEIYNDPNHTTVWNSTNKDAFSVLPYTNYYAYGYGQVPVSQYVTSGNYADTVTAFVTF